MTNLLILLNNVLFFACLKRISYHYIKISHARDGISSLVMSMCHAGICSFYCFMYLVFHDYSYISEINYWSTGYFLYDTILYIIKWNPLYITHHIGSIIVFNFFHPQNIEDLDGNLIILGALISELGNFAVYNVNYKMYTCKIVTSWDLLFECAAFLIWRGLFGIYIMYNMQNILCKLIVAIFWFVSIKWGLAIYTQYRKKVKETHNSKGSRDSDDIRL